MISIIGGVYQEICDSPHWDSVFGSGGRAAACISTRCEVELHTVLSPSLKSEFAGVLKAYDFKFQCRTEDYGVTFKYLNPMSLSEIIYHSPLKPDPIKVQSENLLIFGMLGCSFRAHAEKVVFDPQGGDAQFFTDTGSTADHLIYVLNENELRRLVEEDEIELAATKLLMRELASAVVVKMGPLGARVFTQDGSQTVVPSYRTRRVFKIGSGDVFSAAFAYFWMKAGKSISEAAEMASLVVAAYVETKDPSIAPDHELNSAFKQAVSLPPKRIYLAGPFFSIEQLWLVEHSRRFMKECGATVFSPFHDVGFGGAEVAKKDLDGLDDCDAVFAILNGNDPGTIFEVGYAVARKKRVTVYAERNLASDMTMFEGTGCHVCADYTTALYSAVWDSCE